ncbi:hypothetical protein NDU88_006508 [Pleurodeles waltl]|uniref:Ig-like domain-containing protein n=1 Tax=Pleurodeles waltl TaxID=8319 RepID=A0AAV7NQG0_PLEWA|nr:hypothetical protein NDU88_006508 [Pleurodeles waltl]
MNGLEEFIVVFIMVLSRNLTDSEEIIQPNIIGHDGVNYEDVIIGKSKTLFCTAVTIHSNTTDAISLYWLMTNPSETNFIEIDGVQEILTWNISEGKKYMTSELQFELVKDQHMENNYTCVLQSVLAKRNRTFILRKKDNNTDIPKHAFTTGMIIATVSSIVFVSIGAACFMFRIQIVLLYRSLTGKDDTLSANELLYTRCYFLFPNLLSMAGLNPFKVLFGD